MRQTLFYIPDAIGPLSMFGMTGWASIVWALFCVALVAWFFGRRSHKREVQNYVPVMAIVWLALVFVAPILVEEGFGIPIRGYGVLMLLGVVAGVALALYRARQMRVDPEIIFSLAFVLFVTAIVGARLFYVRQYWNETFKADTWQETIGNVANVTQGGLVVYGALIGGLAGGVWYLRRHKLPMLAIGDMIAPSLLVGLAIGRIGCLMNGCCYGDVCERPWTLTFPFLSPPYQEQLQDGVVPALGMSLKNVQIEEDGNKSTIVVISDIAPTGVAHGNGLKVGAEVTHIDRREVTSAEHAHHVLSYPRSELTIQQHGSPPVTFSLPRSQPIHPTQIYSAINASVLAALLWVAYPHRGRDGAIIALLLTLYPVTRFLLEMIRTDEPSVLIGGFNTGMTISQLVSLGIVIFAMGLWFFILRQPAKVTLPGPKPLTLSVAANS